MRPVYMISGGVTRFARSRKEITFSAMVQEAFRYAMADCPKLRLEHIDGSIASYFSDYFQGQSMAASMVQDYLGLCPKPVKRVEGGGATGGLCFQAAYEAIASGRMEVCAAYGWERMSQVSTWKANELIALASDTAFDYPLGGFYTAYYAMMAMRHQHEFGTTVEQMAKVSVKNHANALHNPFAQKPLKLTVREVRKSGMVAYPFTRLDICVMTDGAACAILASEKAAHRFSKKPIRISAVAQATDSTRLADRSYGIQSFRAGRIAALKAYQMAGIRKPLHDLSFVELHDAYTSAEIQTYEDLGLCEIGEGGMFIESGASEMGGTLPVNPSGGLLACGHPIGATGLAQAVFAFWQLQGSIGKHFGNSRLEIRNARRGLIHSQGGTGTSVTVSILEKD